MTLPASRPLYLLAFIVCVLLMGTALYLEHVVGLEPCPLCIIQRVAVILIGLLCLAAVLHNPKPRNGKRTGARIYGALTLALSLFGGATAARQVWLQHLPADELPTCMLPLDYMLKELPFEETLSLVFSGTADCAEVTWTFLGLSIAEGTLIAFVCFGVFGLMQVVRRID
ncbi:hypothetical protein LCGC14_0046940 [marine sediment metagenome]|uniref:Disulfide bond formation protein B n=1 Tax=marine sediment metagenome TaxID=412755 RepID=A0A0F9Y7T8_9ZZZZ|nr:disulfide bond formation protein B [Halopseudomonas sabulinigri]